MESVEGSGGLTSIIETFAVLQARPAVADGKFALVISDAEEAGVYKQARGVWQKVAGVSCDLYRKSRCRARGSH